MLRALRDLLAVTLVLASHLEAAQAPTARRVEQVDQYHGTDVPDPYRWLEDMASTEVWAWARSQDSSARADLASLPPRAALAARFGQYALREQTSVPQKRGERLFYVTIGAGRSGAIAVREGNGPPRELAAVPAGLLTWVVSPDGRNAVFAVRGAPNLWSIVDVDRGTLWSDSLMGITGTAAAFSWNVDGRGLYYTKQPPGATALDEPQPARIFFHRLGTPQADDVLVFERPAVREWAVTHGVTSDGRHLVIAAGAPHGPSRRVFVRDARDPAAPVRELRQLEQALYTFIDGEGTRLWFLTTAGAPRGRIVEIDLRRPESRAWKELIPQTDLAIIAAQMFNNQFVVTYTKDAIPQIRIFDRQGNFEREAALPGVGTPWSNVTFRQEITSGRRADPEAFYGFLAANQQARQYALDVRTGVSRQLSAQRPAYNPDDYEITQVFYRSKDGTRAPMLLAYRKGLLLDGTRPVLLDGVLADRVVPLSFWQSGTFAWMEAGGIYAFPGGRGGGEYGEDWYRAGVRDKRPTALEDYLAAIEWLIERKYTSAGRVAGLAAGPTAPLLAAAANRRPELFGAVMLVSPLLDLLRLERLPGGRQWVDTYGSAEQAAEFRVLHSYSPYHNIGVGSCHPPTLVFTGDQDATVSPAHAFKYVAALQAVPGCRQPVLLLVGKGQGYTGFGPQLDLATFAMNALRLAPPVAAAP